MSAVQQLVLFSVGVVVGVALLPVLTRIFNPESVHRFFEAVGRVVSAPFGSAGRIFRKNKGEEAARGRAADFRPDPREQQISDSAQAIRSMLLVLTAAIQRIDEAASNSSQALAEVRDTLNAMGLPQDLTQTAAQLVAQIDKMIAGNNALRGELANSHEVLTTQKEIIESLRTAVRVDKMTQFANRSYFDEKLAEMIKLKRRYDEDFFLMLIDIDNFKTINDTYGHTSGDRIIKGVAFKLKSTLRDSDFVARFGGDEFALILIKATPRAAETLAWKLCQCIRDSRFLLDANEVKVTVSIGAAAALGSDTPESLIKRADSALYKVKEGGRNGVQFFEEQ